MKTLGNVLILGLAFQHIPIFQVASRPFQFLGESLFVRQNGLVFRSEDFVGKVVQCVMGLGSTLFGAEDQADWRVLAGLCPVLAGVVEVEMHLASVGIAELADFEVDNDEAPEPPVKEYEVDAEPSVVDPEPTLAANESEVVAQL